jgi:NAD(P)-dependent dehydrogenase (short-subunit alcohol dehydrogenase family)
MQKRTGSDLEGKTAFISGGGSGIGRQIAASLIDAGVRVFVCDADPDHLANFLESHPQAQGQLANIGVQAQVDAAFLELDRFSDRLDILVNNAGIAGPIASVEEIEGVDWRSTLDVNLSGPFYCTKQAVPRIKKTGGGSIINVASNAAFTGVPLRSPYAASKWALIGLTKTWAMELGREGIRVNAVCPGSVEGERIELVIEKDALSRNLSKEEIRSLYRKQNSMRVFIKPEEIAALVTFLCSESAKTISGQAMGIDGHTESLGNWFD